MVTWHVDDLKISHVSQHVVGAFMNQMEREYDKEAPLNQSWGKAHDYLGMMFDYTEEGVLTVDMINYIHGVLDEVAEHFSGSNGTLAAQHLFMINVESDQLQGEKGEAFVRITMQLLY